jgi:hypothetical protein
MANMLLTSKSLITNAWIAATWDEFFAASVNFETGKARCFRHL